MRVKPGVLVAISVLLVLSLACAKPAPSPTPTVKPSPSPAPVAKPTPSPSPKPTVAPSTTPTPKAAPVPKITWKAISFVPVKNERALAYQDFLKFINERAKGELTIEYAGGPEVVAATEQPMAVRNNVVQMAAVGGSHIAGLVSEIPLLALSRVPAKEERSSGAWDLLQERCAKAGLYLLGRMDPKDMENFWIASRKKITRPQEMAGLKFAANGTYVQALAKAVGSSFSVIKMEDAYTGLERGTFDLYCTSIDLLVSLSIHEVAKCIIDHPFYKTNTTMVVNLDTWNKLPQHLQKLLKDAYIEQEPTLTKGSVEGVNKGIQSFKDKKVEFVKFSAEDAKWFLGLAYSSEAEAQTKTMAETGPKFLKMVKAIP